MLLLSFSSSSVAATHKLLVLLPSSEQPSCDGQSQGKLFAVLRQSDQRLSRAQAGKLKRPGPRPAALGKARTNIPLRLIRLRLRVRKVTACPESAGWSRGPERLSLEERGQRAPSSLSRVTTLSLLGKNPSPSLEMSMEMCSCLKHPLVPTSSGCPRTLYVSGRVPQDDQFIQARTISTSLALRRC